MFLKLRNAEVIKETAKAQLLSVGCRMSKRGLPAEFGISEVWIPKGFTEQTPSGHLLMTDWWVEQLEKKIAEDTRSSLVEIEVFPE